MVRSVSVDNRGLWKYLAKLLAAFLPGFDDLHLHANLKQLGRKIEAHMAASANQHLLHSGIPASQRPEECLQILMGRGNMHLVTFLEDKVSIRNIHLSASFYGAYQDLNLEFLVYFGQGQACKRTFVSKVEFYQFHSSLHKCLYLACLREKQHS